MSQAFVAAYLFLKDFWEKNPGVYQADLPVLLGAMAPLSDGAPADVGLLADWDACSPSDEDDFDALLCFLTMIAARGETAEHDISRLIERLHESPDAVRQAYLDYLSAVRDASPGPELAVNHPLNGKVMVGNSRKRSTHGR